MKKKLFIVGSSNKGERLDVFLQGVLKDFTRSYIKTLNQNKNILVNSQFVKSGYNLKESDQIEVKIPFVKPLNIEPEEIKLNIIFQDEDLAVINKPQNMVVHPASGNKKGTLVNALLFNIKNLSKINGYIRPGIVHRLDKDTSGLILVAKNDKAHLSLQKQIQNKTCRRLYKAIVYGKFSKDEGVIETQLARGKREFKKVFVVPDGGQGRKSITFFKVLGYSNGFSFVEFELKTGRTHQIRAHCAFINHPIVGDKLYGRKNENFGLKGQLLHSFCIEFIHPTKNKEMKFEAPLPDYFEKFLNEKFC